MASLWPRSIEGNGFEREGDREYMAPEILQGRYGPAADVFRYVFISFVLSHLTKSLSAVWE